MLLKSPPIESVRAAVDADFRVDRRPAQILTVNVEDYFQAGVFHRFIDSRNWYRFDSRLQKNVEETLSVLDEHDSKATFFVLGWIAEKHPELVRRIAAEGHEVASRGYLHQPLLKLSREQRQEDLTRSRHLLEEITGTRVMGFRLSDGWLRKADMPFLEEVREAGYLYDSSLMPRRMQFRGEPDRRYIRQHELRSGTLIEIPLSTIPVAGSWMPIAGGNYQRQLPHWLMQSAVERWTKTETAPYVMYFQIWEMDDEQPEMSAVSRLTRIRHYRNLGKYRRVLPEYLRTWRFTSVRDHAALPQSPLACLTRPATEISFRRTSPTAGRTAEPAIVSTSPAACGLTSIHPDVTLRKCETVRTGVTLVIPCFNEEGSLPYLARTLEHLQNTLSQNYGLKILFVDDCSRDTTRDVLQALFGSQDNVQIIHHDVNCGVSAAILTGLRNATTDIVCSIDCDCSYDPHELEQMLPLMKPGVALVTASPYHRHGSVRNVPGWRLVLSHTLSKMYRTLLHSQLSTWTSCFRVYRRSHILDLPLQESGFLGTAELAAQLCLHGRTIVEHPAVLEVRLFGFSKMKTLRTIVSHLKLLGKVVRQKFAPREHSLWQN